jgi:hypothetical protein
MECSRPSWLRRFQIQIPPRTSSTRSSPSRRLWVRLVPPPAPQLLPVCEETGPDLGSINPLHCCEKKGSLLCIQSACRPVHGIMAFTSQIDLWIERNWHPLVQGRMNHFFVVRVSISFILSINQIEISFSEMAPTFSAQEGYI